ncbi:MAG TPA: FAD-binding protein, partial [Acetobacteraceae bacterium]|nr:FAD-binding protein [Acetobacteraceae bacterium]
MADKSERVSGRADIASAGPPPGAWQAEADIVVIGSGATGMTAAIVAREAGASVIVVEQEHDI